MYDHFRKKHPHLIEVHNIPKKRDNLTCPEHLLTYKVEFVYLKKKVHSLMNVDRTKLKKMKEYKRGPKYEEYKQNIPHYELMVEHTNEIRHDIATQCMDIFLAQKHLDVRPYG